MMIDKHPLACDCGLPAGYLQNGLIVIECRHHGQKHVTYFSLLDLLVLAYGQERATKLVQIIELAPAG